MPGTSYAKKVDEWRFLAEQAAPLIVDAPHLAAEHAALVGLLAEVDNLRRRSEEAKAARLEANHLRREALRRGSELRDRLAGALVHQFGPRSERLVHFGLSPRKRVIHRTTKAEKDLAEAEQQIAELEEQLSESGAPAQPPVK